MTAVLNQEFKIRNMELLDIDSVHSIEHRAYEYPWSKGIFHECMKCRYFCWVLELHEKIVAYAVFSLADDEAHLLNIVVDPEVQQQGVGRYLLRRVIEASNADKAQTIFLEVRESNSVAYDMYLKEDFVQVGERRNYYKAKNGRENAIILALPLTDTFPGQ